MVAAIPIYVERGDKKVFACSIDFPGWCRGAKSEELAVEALALMEQRKITSIVVIDADRRVEGVVHLHDLWRTGFV